MLQEPYFWAHIRNIFIVKNISIYFAARIHARYHKNYVVLAYLHKNFGVVNRKPMFFLLITYKVICLLHLFSLPVYLFLFKYPQLY